MNKHHAETENLTEEDRASSSSVVIMQTGSVNAQMSADSSRIGFVGRLTKGAGTHLASWLQEVKNVEKADAIAWLQAPRHPKTKEVVAGLRNHHNSKTAGHSCVIVDAAFSGELLVTKDENSMRLWRAKDFNLLRVVSACPGRNVAFSPNGNNIVTGTLVENSGEISVSKLKIWGPAGNSAVGCGNTKITAGKA